MKVFEILTDVKPNKCTNCVFMREHRVFNDRGMCEATGSKISDGYRQILNDCPIVERKREVE